MYTEIMYTCQLMNVFENTLNWNEQKCCQRKNLEQISPSEPFQAFLSSGMTWLLHGISEFVQAMSSGFFRGTNTDQAPAVYRKCWESIKHSAESSHIVANHRVFFAIWPRASNHLLQRSLDTLFLKRWSFSKLQMWWVFFPLALWGETCQCRAENYQGLDLGPWRVNWNRFAPEKTLRTWRKTNASRSTIRRKWICPRQLREIRWFLKGWIKNRTSENQTRITSCCEIHGKSMDIRFIITRVVNFSPRKCSPEGLHGCNEAMDRETYHRDVGLWGWHRGGAWMPSRWGSGFSWASLNENGSS